MKLVVDANVLFAGLIRDSLTRRLFFNLTLELCSPELCLAEFKKYGAFLLGKSRLNRKEFEIASEVLWSRIEVIPDEELKPFMPAASMLVSDEKDWLYLAAALFANADLWSNDYALKKQSRIKTWTTTEIAQELGYL